MCGIIGAVDFDAGPAADLAGVIEPGLRTLERRGPDGVGRYSDARGIVALGHRRLSIIDLSERGAQPMQTEDGALVVTFNGEIYNYRALRAELEQVGVRFRSESDTEVLLHLYRAHGPAMLPKLHGMFAFALWDATAQTLLLARDPYGIKPLYLARQGTGLRFASQVRALLATGVSPAVDEAALAGFYLLGSVPEPLTIAAVIETLPAGTYLLVRAGQRNEPVSYFSIPEVYATGERRAQHHALDEQALHEALRESVAHHLVADVPVGIFLSAGVDSGALLGLMRDVAGAGASIDAVTLVFDEHRGRADDEGPLAAKVAAAYGARHTARRVERTELESDLPAFFAAMDQPTIDGINSWLVSKAARELGLKVALSGLGGDELLGGYPSFSDVPRFMRAFGWTEQVSRLLPNDTAVGFGLRSLAGSLLKRAGISPKALLLLEHGGTLSGAYLARRGLFMPWELPALMGQQAAERGLARLAMLSRIDDLVRARGDFARIATLETCLYMRNQLLRDTDWASMAQSLEVRVPLVDAALLRAFAEQPLQGTRGKELLANAPRAPLPAEIVRRPKTGFTTPVGTWLQASPLLQAWRGVDALQNPRTHWARRYAYCAYHAWRQA